MFLLFDAYGTLVKLDDFYGRLQVGFARRGAVIAPDVVRQAAQAEMAHYIEHAHKACNEASREMLRYQCAGVLAAAIRRREYSLDWPIETVQQVLVEAVVFRGFPEVKEVLAALQARGVAMGVLSNWDYSLPQELEKLGLLPYFRFVLTSAQAGARKPERVFFERGLQQARREYSALPSSPCFYIGDHYENDVLGARAAGLTPLWLVRDRRDLASGETHAADDAVTRITSLRGLLDIAL